MFVFCFVLLLFVYLFFFLLYVPVVLVCLVLAFLLMMFETSLTLCTTGTWMSAPCCFLSALLMASADVSDYTICTV